jgi:hypothetical protein
MKSQKISNYRGQVPKHNRKIVEIETQLISLTHIHDPLLSWLGTGTSLTIVFIGIRFCIASILCFSFHQIYEDNTIILIYFIENKSELSHIKLSTICKTFKCIYGYAKNPQT